MGRHYLDETFAVRSYESGVTNHVSLPSLCNFMQEIAGLNAEKLGWGIRKLQEEGLTWMLSRLHLKVARYVPWGEKITLRTWPSGMKGRHVFRMRPCKNNNVKLLGFAVSDQPLAFEPR